MPNWLGFALDAAEWILKHPLPAGEEPTFDSKISSVGKKRIYYSKSDLYEELELQVNFDIDAKEGKCTLTRSGLGAVTTVRYFTSEESNVSLQWGSSYYQLSSDKDSYSASDGVTGTTGITIRMLAQTVNELPTVETDSTIILSHSSYQVIGTRVYPSGYAENTFFTNNSGYVSNHTLITKNTFNICQLVSPIYSGTVINGGNINDFRKYGYDIDLNNNITLDNDALLAYIQNELLPQLELQYRNTYVDFPEPGATYGDDDIIYINPFDDGEIDTTNSGGVPALWNGETYILETSSFNVDYPEAVQSPYDTLKQSANIPPSLIQSAGGMITEAFAIVPSEYLSFYCFAMLLSIVLWFVFRK